MKQKNYGITLLSGGYDSTTLALKLLADKVPIRGLFFNVGQVSAKRQEAVIRGFGMDFNIPIDVANMNLADLYLPIIPLPHILVIESGIHPLDPDKTGSSGGVLVAAGLFAANSGVSTLYYSITGDELERAPHFGEVIRLAEALVRVNTQNSAFQIKTPLAEMNHSDVLRLYKSLGEDVPTWSCHWGNMHHCGSCNGCNTRKDRYKAAGITDETIYMSS